MMTWKLLLAVTDLTWYELIIWIYQLQLSLHYLINECQDQKNNTPVLRGKVADKKQKITAIGKRQSVLIFWFVIWWILTF